MMLTFAVPTKKNDKKFLFEKRLITTFEEAVNLGSRLVRTCDL